MFAWRAHLRSDMAEVSSNPPTAQTSNAQGTGVAGESSATQDLVDGLALLMSAASKALCSVESRDAPSRGRATACSSPADDWAELADIAGGRMLEIASQVVTDLSGIRQTTPIHQPPSSGEACSAHAGQQTQSCEQQDD